MGVQKLLSRRLQPHISLLTSTHSRYALRDLGIWSRLNIDRPYLHTSNLNPTETVRHYNSLAVTSGDIQFHRASDQSHPLNASVDIKENSGPIANVHFLSNGESVAIEFDDGIFTFHAQWLYDAEVEAGPSKGAGEVFTRTPATARIRNTSIIGRGASTLLYASWENGKTSQFPAPWLRAYASLVAKGSAKCPRQSFQPGWLASKLVIPEIQYSEICSGPEPPPDTLFGIYDALLLDSAPGIIKIVGLPDPALEDERDGVNTLLTHVLRRIFGSVFQHPRREPNTTFNIASHYEKDVSKGTALPNYDTTQLLLPHIDLSHYTYPSRIQGLYALEGESENTFVSCHSVLGTFKEEAPHLLRYLYTTPTAIGRVAHWYKPPLYQGTVDTMLTTRPGFPDQVKRFRWHPHLSGSLISPYDEFLQSRAAYQKFQEIIRRDTHLLKIHFKPGDLYIWDNFRILHGREQVLRVPRTSVGQTVPEQVVADRDRVLKMSKVMKYIEEKWLIHMPQPQLNDMVDIVQRWES